VGLAGIGFGVDGLWSDPGTSDHIGMGKWLVGGLVLHDGVFALLVFGVGALSTRLIPAVRLRHTVLGGLAVGTAATLVALPALMRTGPVANDSVLPLDYGWNLALIWLLVLLGTAAVCAVRALRRRPTG